MLFNSVSFLIFFPIVTLVYFLIPKKYSYLWLLAASYYFYMCWNPKYALLLLTSTAVTYAASLLIAGAKEARARRWYVAASFCANLAILFFFKYFTFAADSLRALFAHFGVALAQPKFDVVLPVGISFYTFQALSYTADVYRGRVRAERNFFRYALFVSFFPQLVAGPIERTENLLPQLQNPKPFDALRARRGLVMMLWGFFQKLVIADRVAILVNQVFSNLAKYSGAEVALASVLFAVQIYCDFGGYSNIAVGAAEVMGYSLMENFHKPYFASSVRDFWRRWHISLSTWFRDYLYIPLGGSRKGKLRTWLNTMLTFLASGLWHGAGWHFVLWGGLHGLYLVVGSWTLPARKKLRAALRLDPDRGVYHAFRVLVTFLLVLFAWIFFRAASVSQAFLAIRLLFSRWDLGIFTNGAIYTLGLDAADFWAGMAAIAILFAVDLLSERRDLRDMLEKKNLFVRWPVYLLMIFTVLIFGIYGPQYSAGAFIYFQF
jgi:alginate O-acetyltransferase complex protein AlgI